MRTGRQKLAGEHRELHRRTQATGGGEHVQTLPTATFQYADTSARALEKVPSIRAFSDMASRSSGQSMKVCIYRFLIRRLLYVACLLRSCVLDSRGKSTK